MYAFRLKISEFMMNCRWGIAGLAILYAMNAYAVECRISSRTTKNTFEKYTDDQLGIAFEKPKNWETLCLNKTLYIKPRTNGTTMIFLYPIWKVHPKIKAMAFLHFVYTQTQKQYPDLHLVEKKMNKADTMGEVIVLYTKGQDKMKGAYIVSLDKGRGIYCGYEDRVNQYDSSQEVLRRVLKSLNIKPMDFDKMAENQRLSTRESNRPLKPTIDPSQLVLKSSPDNSMYLAVPQDWVVGGGNFVLAATSPDEKMAVLATNDQQPRTMQPEIYFSQFLMPFYRCQQTKIKKQEPNREIMQLLRSQGMAANAVNFSGETVQMSGQKVFFWIMVNAVVTGYGLGFVSTIGFYATPELFTRNYPVLYAITASMNPNQEVIMGRLNHNLAGLAKASQTLSETSDLVIQGLRSASANTDRAFDKYNYYLSGEEARYSPLENKIYVVDANLSNYASNPHYPQEMLTTVPDHLWNTLKHERDY